MKKKPSHLLAVLAVGLACIAGPAAAADKPNIVVLDPESRRCAEEVEGDRITRYSE